MKSNYEYKEKNIQHLYFSDKMMNDIYLTEQIDYNNKTGNICINSRFTGFNNSLIFIDIGDDK